LLAAFLIALLIVGLGVIILGLNKLDRVNPGVAPIFILAGLPVIWLVALDVVDRIVAVRHLARLVQLFDEDDMAYMVDLLTDAATISMVPHTRFETKWRILIEFLNVDYYGSIASQALFQRSHTGRLKYFEQVARIAGLRFRGRLTKRI
jgi:hypothetical protein